MAHQYAVQVILDHFPNLTAEYVTGQLRYSSFVSVPKRYMYFAVPKAACTQMKELLRTVEKAPPIKLLAGRDRETQRSMFVHARQNVPLPSLADLGNTTQREVLGSPDFLRITFVRNPYSRLVSAWRNKIMLCEPGAEEVYLQVKGHLPEFSTKKCLISFEEFVEYIANNSDLRSCDAHWRRQVDHTFFPALNFSCVAKVEQMAEGLRRFQQHLALSEPLMADGRNASASIGSATYNEDLADRVYSLYRADFDVLGYDRNTWAAAGQIAKETPKNGAVTEERFRHEIIERNIIISGLYREREQLRAEVQKLSRLHLLSIADGLIAFRRASRRLLSEVKGRMQTVFRW